MAAARGVLRRRGLKNCEKQKYVLHLSQLPDRTGAAAVSDRWEGGAKARLRRSAHKLRQESNFLISIARNPLKRFDSKK